MTDMDAIARLLDVGFNAVFLFLLWRVYQDFMKGMERHITYLEKLTERLLPDDEAPTLPTPPARYQAPLVNGYSRTPTELGERERQGAD
jgi:hypothetical protein